MRSVSEYVNSRSSRAAMAWRGRTRAFRSGNSEPSRCQPERAAWGVLAGRPRLAGMHHASAQRFHLRQRTGGIIYREVSREKESPGPRPRGWIRTGGTADRDCQPSPSASLRRSRERRARRPKSAAHARVRRPGSRPAPTTTAPRAGHNARRARSVDAGDGVPKAQSGGVSALRDAVGPAAQHRLARMVEPAGASSEALGDDEADLSEEEWTRLERLRSSRAWRSRWPIRHAPIDAAKDRWP
jgi:hypothetical protein